MTFPLSLEQGEDGKYLVKLDGPGWNIETAIATWLTTEGEEFVDGRRVRLCKDAALMFEGFLIKWFNEPKGHGFFRLDDGSSDRCSSTSPRPSWT
jgi:hypothetical protein